MRARRSGSKGKRSKRKSKAELLEQAKQAERQLEALLEEGILFSKDQSLDATLQRIVNVARHIIGCQYAALGVIDEEGKIRQFFQAGLDEETVRRIGDLPTGKGILGVVIEEGKPLRLRDLTQHPRSYGFPPHHPPMKTFLGVPIIIGDKPFGRLYMTEKIGADEFTERDERLALTLAAQAAMAIERAQLFEQAGLAEKLQRAYDEMKAMQEQIIRSERLRALGQMASGIVHDINNSLSAITLFATIGLRHKNLDSELRRCFENINKAATDATNTVTRLREFYRPRAPHEASELVDMNEVVRDVILLTQPKWKDEPQAKGVSIEIITDLQATLSVLGNASELREVLTNFIFNAVDAMPEGGVITIRTWDEKDEVLASVADTGVGMDEETKLRIFEPFFTTKGPQGTGLGLSVCWGIVQRHGGKVTVESEVGKGSVFTVRLPAAIEERRKAREEEMSLPSLRILCVDDEPLVREGLKKLLMDMGHTVTVASDGKEALEKFGSGVFDVVITDLGMPKVSGHEVARAVKQQSPQTPVILLTGWGEWHGARHSTEVDLVMSKPPTPESLETALRSVLRL